ncbi:hypothetical protein PHLGIDRAFT_173175 [Phlebiopsis gigantea 11061_1 CR5-6]|uniref:Uncharacterized protein n=1 Tax=Phlebiopsis gigantea (strain 11061_1 CR5-6) TaxID=745531 RepID=A0A0C3SCL4_PHLG1|nr:hypothetical protein PHLGIDRAFT_173175 [Phlebiopsis gigantea 11061_1 CR5-6]
MYSSSHNSTVLTRCGDLKGYILLPISSGCATCSQPTVNLAACTMRLRRGKMSFRAHHCRGGPTATVTSRRASLNTTRRPCECPTYPHDSVRLLSSHRLEAAFDLRRPTRRHQSPARSKLTFALRMGSSPTALGSRQASLVPRYVTPLIDEF